MPRRSPQLAFPRTSHRQLWRFSARPLTLSVHLAMAAMGLGMAGWAQQVQAAGTATLAAAAHHYEIPAGPLAAVLTRFSAEAGIYLAGSAELARGKRSPGLSGNFSTQGGLAALLAGTGLQAVSNAQGQYVLREAPATTSSSGNVATLPAVRVVGSADSMAERLNPSTTVGSKIPLAQREIPQTVSVVTSQQIEQQKLVDLNDAAIQMPGVTAAPYNAGQVDLYARGFPIDIIQFDGIPFNINTSANGLTNLNLAMYDHIETLDGPAGLLSGFGGAGGAINLVRKRPKKDFSLDGEVSVGNYADRRESLDVTGPLNEAGTVRGRFVESGQDTHLQADDSFKKQILLYGIVEADLTPDTLLTVGGSYQRIRQKAMLDGYPAWSNAQLLDKPTQYIGSPDDREDYTTTTLFGSLEQKLGRGWKAKFSAQAWNTSSSQRGAFPFGSGVDVDTGNTSVTTFSNRESNVQRTLDLFAAGPVSLFGRTHQLTLGVDYQTYHFGLHDIFNFGNYQTYNYFNPVQPVFFEGNARQTSYVDTSQFNLYTNARISITDPLTLVVGGAISWWKVDNTYGSGDQNTFGIAPSSYSLSAKVTPFAGVIYDINKNLSAYASYTSIFEPQTAIDQSGNLIAPLKGKQMELGIKGEYLDGKLNTSASVFQIDQENRAVPDPADPLSGFDVATGKARSRGFQLSASGELLPGWTIYGGYTYTDVVSFDSSDSATGTSGQSFSSIAPKYLLRLWTNYRLPGYWHKLSVGGGINVSSRYYVQTSDYTLSQGGFATVDLRAGYDISKNVSAQLNVNNLFNRSYYQALGGLGNGNFLGAPRTVMLSLHFKM